MKIKALTIALALCVSSAPVTASDRTMIGEIVWYQVSSYCTFFHKGHQWNYDDHETWRFVFISGFNEPQFGYMRLDGELRELRPIKDETQINANVDRYRTSDENPYFVSITKKTGESGTEHTAMTGTIEVSSEGRAETIEFEGDCGV